MLKLAVVMILLAGSAGAQDRRSSHCIALAEAVPGIEHLQKAAFRDPLAAETVRLSYVAHSTYVLETNGGFTAATDFTGYLGPVDLVPRLVTMNHAHESHWTSILDPRIPHVLRGWGDGTGPADHYVDLGEVLIRNVPTDIRARFGSGIEAGGNSIFIFEVAGLCIGHLGHLHHEPTPEQYAAIGRLDVVMAAVDGGMTLDTATMTRILKRLRSSIVLPMHWFSGYALSDFLDRMAGDFDIVRTDLNSIEISLSRLPSRPQIIVLQPQYLEDRVYDD